MTRHPARLRSLAWLLPALAAGCNAIFGVVAGEVGSQASHGATSGTGGASVASASSGAGTGATGGAGTGGVGTGGTGGAPTCAPDRIPACNADGGVCTPVVVDDTPVDALDVVVSGDDLFLATGDSGKVRRVRYDGAGVLDIGAKSTFRIGTDGVQVFWTSYYGGIKACALDGAGLTTIAQSPTNQPIGDGRVIARNHEVYWTAYGPPEALWRARDDASEQQTPLRVVSSDDAIPTIDGPNGLAVDDAYLYWGSSDGVHRMKVADVGTPAAAVEDFDIDPAQPVAGVTMDADRVYWFSSFGHVRSKAKTAPPSQSAYEHLPGSQDDLVAIAVDEASVFWITVKGDISKTSKTGATVTPVASGPPDPFGLAVDCGAVYWTVGASANFATGRLFKAAKGP